MLIWLLFSLISSSSQHGCGVGQDWHPEIHKYPHKGRRLEVGLDRGTAFKPLRIYFEYSALTLTTDQLASLKNNVLPSVQHWFQTVLSVNPLLNNLIIPQATCNDIPIPVSHQTEGLDNTDFVVYLSSDDPMDGTTVAYAGPCLQDSGGRFNVLAGSFTIHTRHFFRLPEYKQISTAIHELTHALVFSQELFSTFVKPDGNLYTENEIYKKVYYKNRAKIVTLLNLPTVTKNAREIYGCSSIPGLELEDYGSSNAGSHWEMKVVADDYMIYDPPDFASYSNLTLALFQDSGWYKVDFSYAQPIIIGKNEGCERFEDKCITNGVAQPGFCTETGNTCDYTKTAPSNCRIYLHDYRIPLPLNYQYFPNYWEGGNEYSEYCPLMRIEPFQYQCRDSSKGYDESTGSKHGSSSRCFESSLILETAGKSPVMSPLCYEIVGCEEDHVVISLGSETVSCPFSGGSVSMPGYDGVLTCPDSSICNEVVPCYNSCYGQGKCPKGTCICDPGFGGLDCSIVCDSSCKSCNDQSSCTSCYSTASLADGICSCPDGSTWDDTQKACMPGTIIGCPKECNGCADETACADCYDSMTLNDQNLCECPSGQAFNSDTNTCETITGCPESCNGCKTPQICLSCYDQATLQNGECICPKGFYFDSETKTCIAYLTDNCGPYCLYCKSENHCEKCDDQMTTLNPDTGKCDCNLRSYYFLFRGRLICDQCSTGCQFCDSRVTCDFCNDEHATIYGGTCQCSIGYYNDSPDQYLSCKKCKSECYTCYNGSSCSECADHNAMLISGKCVCKEGTFLGYDNWPHQACLRKIYVACAERCKTCNNQYVCIACRDGYIIDINGVCHCGTGFYEFFDGNKNICKCKKYLACDENCNNSCNMSDECSKCASTVLPSNDQCKEINFGFNSKFKDGIITITFVADIGLSLSKRDFQVKNDDERDFDTENWWLEKESKTIYKIHTDLKKTDLPVKVVLDFNRHFN